MERTVGFELEVADVIKSNVKLPAGYKWSDDETIINTYGKIVTANSPIGGELNTAPLSFTQKDRDSFREVFDSIWAANGANVWCHGFAGHIYVGDFDVEQLKQVFLLSYHTAVFIKDIASVGEWSEYSNQAPSPTKDFADNTRRCSNLEELRNVFANSSTKGFFRHLINITSFWKHKTIEFRIFNPTYKFEEIENSAFFMYRFINYAISHDERDFEKIRSTEDFRQKIKFHKSLACKLSPLIFSGAQNSESDRYVSRPIGINKDLLSEIVKLSSGKLTIVNPNFFEHELRLSQYLNLVIYNFNDLNHMLYRIWDDGLKISFNDVYSILNEYDNGTSWRMISLVAFLHSTRNYAGGKTDFHIKTFNAIIAGIDETLKKIDKWSLRLVSMFENCEYHIGSIEDAIKSGDKNLLYQYENTPKLRQSFGYIKKYTDYDFTLEKPLVRYDKIDDMLSSEQNLMLVSFNTTLTYHKYALKKTYSETGGITKQCLYCSIIPKSAKIVNEKRRMQMNYFKGAPDSLDIINPSLLVVRPVKSTVYYSLAKEFVKKVDKIATPRFPFIVMYDDFLLGGFAFDYAKGIDCDLWLLSDFAVNNNIPRIAKLILLCVKSTDVKRYLQRKCMVVISSIYTKVYTTMPVSMKYRGLFKKEGRIEDRYLLYTATIGVYDDNKHIIDEYQKMIKR